MGKSPPDGVERYHGSGLDRPGDPESEQPHARPEPFASLIGCPQADASRHEQAVEFLGPAVSKQATAAARAEAAYLRRPRQRALSLDRPQAMEDARRAGAARREAVWRRSHGMKTRPLLRSRIWAIPSILAALTLLSLVMALVVDGLTLGQSGQRRVGRNPDLHDLRRVSPSDEIAFRRVRRAQRRRRLARPPTRARGRPPVSGRPRRPRRRLPWPRPAGAGDRRGAR